MRFRLIKDSFRRLGECTGYGTIPLYSEVNGKNLFLPVGAELLLQLADEAAGWYDLDSLTKDFDETRRRACEDALVILACFGIAECEQVETKSQEGVFVAGEREYEEVSRFIQAAQAEGGGYLLEGRGLEDFFSVSAVRARQFNNVCYHFMYRRDGRMEAVLLVSMMPKETLPTAVMLGGLLFRAGLAAEEQKKFFHALLRHVAEAFAADFSKLRFFYKNDTEADTLSLLLEEGFRKVAVLSHELSDGGSVVLYDYSLVEG